MRIEPGPLIMARKPATTLPLYVRISRLLNFMKIYSWFLQTMAGLPFDIGPCDEPSYQTGRKTRTGSIRGHSRLLKKRPTRVVSKRTFSTSLFSNWPLIEVTTSDRGHYSLFGLMKSWFSYPSLVRVASIRPRFLNGLITTIDLRPRVTSNRGHSFFRPRIRSLLDPA